MKFTKTKYKAIIHSEGPNLEIVKDVENILYLKCFCLNGSGYIYTKLSKNNLQTYFEDKITLKELYLLGIDEQYFVKTRFETPPSIRPMRFMADDSIFDTIECGNELYNQLSKDMILKNPMVDIIENIV